MEKQSNAKSATSKHCFVEFDMIAYREKEFKVIVYYIPLSIKVLKCQVYYSFLPHLELIANILIMYRKWIFISTNT